MLSISVLVFALCASLLLLTVDAQRTTYFRQINPRTQTWAPRQKANIEHVKRTTTFRDGLRSGNSYPLTNYFLLYGGVGAQGPLNDVSPHSPTTFPTISPTPTPLIGRPSDGPPLCPPPLSFPLPLSLSVVSSLLLCRQLGLY